jgi:hypothetical protein
MKYSFSIEYFPRKEKNLTDTLSKYYEKTVKVIIMNKKRVNLDRKLKKRI